MGSSGRPIVFQCEAINQSWSWVRPRRCVRCMRRPAPAPLPNLHCRFIVWWGFTPASHCKSNQQEGESQAPPAKGWHFG